MPRAVDSTDIITPFVAKDKNHVDRIVENIGFQILLEHQADKQGTARNSLTHWSSLSLKFSLLSSNQPEVLVSSESEKEKIKSAKRAIEKGAKTHHMTGILCFERRNRIKNRKETHPS